MDIIYHFIVMEKLKPTRFTVYLTVNTEAFTWFDTKFSVSTIGFEDKLATEILVNIY